MAQKIALCWPTWSQSERSDLGKRLSQAAGLEQQRKTGRMQPLVKRIRITKSAFSKQILPL